MRESFRRCFGRFRLTYEIWRRSRTKCSFWRFKVTRWEVIFAFCVTGAMLWKRVNASAWFSRGRRSTLQCGVLLLCGRRSILWRVRNVFAMNRSVRAQYFGDVSISACCFHVAGATLSDVANAFFLWIVLSGQRKHDAHDAVSKIVAGAAFCERLEEWWKLREIHAFWALSK